MSPLYKSTNKENNEGYEHNRTGASLPKLKHCQSNSSRIAVKTILIMIIFALLASCLLSAPASAAEVTIASESFDTGSIPVGWADDGWNYGTSDNRVGTGGFVYSNTSTLLTLFGEKAYLTSPTIDLDGIDNAYVKFNATEHETSLLIGDATALLDMSVDGGVWQNIWSGEDFDPRTIILQLPDTAVGHKVQFRFCYMPDGIIGLLQSRECQVDDFSVYATNTAGQVQFDPSAYAVDETTSSAALTVTRTDGTAGAVSVDYVTSDGTAIAGTNYQATSGTLNFLAGQSTATIMIPIKDDGADNGDKSFSVAIINPTGGLFLGSPTTATVTVNDVSGIRNPLFQFSADNYTVLETATSMSLTVERVGSNIGATSVECKFIDVSAVNGVNYQVGNTTVNFADGDSSESVVVNILSDGPNNGDKVFWVWLMNPATGTMLGYPVTTIVTVLDDPDQNGDFQFSTTNYEVDETQASLDVVVTRTVGSPATSVNYATSDGTAVAGTNYGAVSGTLNFAVGQTSATITVPIMDDGGDNGDKAFTMTLSNAVGGTIGTPTATITVNDVSSADRDRFQFSTTNYVVDETTASLGVVVTRVASSSAASVDYATSDGTAVAGTNYGAVSGTLNFAAGQTSKTINVPIKDDGANNGDKQFTMTLSNATIGTIGTPTATITVKDVPNADRGQFQFNATDYFVYENASYVTLNVERYGGSKGAASVQLKYLDITAFNGVNYNAVNTTLNFADGEASKAVNVPILDDGPDNGDKVFWIWLMNPTNDTSLGYPVTSVITVKDVDSSHRQTTYAINLVPGWNLISLPASNQALTESDLLNNTSLHILMIAVFDNASQSYVTYTGSSLDTNLPVTIDRGYFILCDGTSTLYVTGVVPNAHYIDISQGWNMVGWSNNSVVKASDVMTQQAPYGLMLARFDVPSQSFVTYTGSTLDENFDVKPTEGYFILSNCSTTLYIGKA